jgi:hypothetical protein
VKVSLQAVQKLRVSPTMNFLQEGQNVGSDMGNGTYLAFIKLWVKNQRPAGFSGPTGLSIRE